MSNRFESLAMPGVLGLHPYVPGKPVETLKREFGVETVVKLASNENPLGPSPKVAETIVALVGELARYPDGESFRLKAALARKLGVQSAQITLGNGSNDVLEIIGRTFSGPGVDVVFSQYAFAVYALVTQAVDARAIVVPARSWGHDLSAMAEAVTDSTRLIYLANPNNPTGTGFTESDLIEFLRRVPSRVLVVLDEAYIEYQKSGEGTDGVRLLEQFPNLIVCRTFSKAYGLAGLRVGYVVSHPDVAELLNRVRQPFNVNLLAQEAALVALADEAHLQEGVAVNRAGMAQLETGLRKRGLDWIPSVANFIAVDFGKDAGEINQALLRRGVIVRPLAGYGMPGHLRVSIGLESENEAFLAALDSIDASGKAGI